MSFYSIWYERNVCKKVVKKKSQKIYSKILPGELRDAAPVDFTAAQVTVHAKRDCLVYNLEFKARESIPSNVSLTNPTSRRFRKASYNDNSRSTLDLSTEVTIPSISSFQRRKHKRTYNNIESDALSTISANSQLTNDTLWDGWIVKFINYKENNVDDGLLEDWIF
ncbi:13416_t:CDS:1 [Ambispora leptoticha]|uniref:13416_t:CDS:1 n=1 Tax=Ambispora leptoticha TaxID=144679 RepID=A0A9N9C1V3_9GLOM|nr:13416_t:CDS:1 [Ambispora leptoticha]